MRKRIAFISEHASPLAALGGVDAGGQNVYVAELAKYLAKIGYEVDVYTRWEDKSQEKVVNWLENVRVVHVKAGPVKYIQKEDLLKYMPEFRENMVQFIQQEEIQYALIHANFWMSALVASEIKEQLGIPYVITFHALGQVRQIYQKEQDKFPPERIEIEARTAKMANQVIAECPQDKEDLINYYDVDPEKITIIPCGFDPNEFYPVNKSFAKTLLRLEQDEDIILQLGRMVPRKGVDNVIKSLSYLKEFNRKIRLVIVGGESNQPDPLACPEIGRLSKLAEQEGVLDNITFVGRKDREMLKYYYSAADIFVTTPWYEPFGITPLEAMACGTPVIGANVGGIKFSIKDGHTGYLVPPKDPYALAGKIEYLLSDKAVMQKMKRNAIKRVHAFFTWAKVATTVASMYEKVLMVTNSGPAKVTRKSKKPLAPVITMTTRERKAKKLG